MKRDADALDPAVAARRLRKKLAGYHAKLRERKLALKELRARRKAGLED
jgi:hypothetical protein